jgi:RHS repeat-associated protein
VRSLVVACTLLLASNLAHAVVPTAPTNLAATAVSTTQIDLSWTDTSNNEASFKIERKTGSGGSYSQIATVGTNVVTFSNTGRTAGTIYFYRVRASNASGNSAYTNEASATTLVADTIAPSVPSGLTATAVSASQIDLSWTASSDNVGVVGYRVNRAEASLPHCGQFAQIGSPAGTSFSDTGIHAPTLYCYSVAAVDAAGNVSGVSSSVFAPLDTTAPTAPGGLAATAASATQINLSWTASTDDVGVTAYQVDRCQSAGCASFAQITTPTGTSFSDTGLAAGTSYSYRVRAADAAGNLSAYSNLASANTASAQAQMYYIVPDHLNTPRFIADSTGTTVWRWDQGEPFGNDEPNNNPSGVGAFDFPLRFPGQYFDRETNLTYNYFRDYDPASGRYVESDPIGLGGGLLTYVYIDSGPIVRTDPLGLFFPIATMNEFTRSENRIPTEDAIRVSDLTSAVSVAGVAVAAAGPIVIATAVEVGAVACRVVPEIAPKVAEACKNPLVAFMLGATICGNVSGTVKDSAREYSRVRERLQEIRDASERVSRGNGTTRTSR